MTIQLSPALEKRVARAAKEKGIQPQELVEAAVKAYLKPPRKTQESESRKHLRELTEKYKTRKVDFDTAVHEARAYAYKLYEDNVEYIELASKRYNKSSDTKAK